MLMFMLIVLVIFLCAFGFMVYSHEVEKRKNDKRRNIYNDRV